MLLLNTNPIITRPCIDSADSVSHAESFDSTGNADCADCVGYAVMIHNRPAVMVSPLDIQTYILQIPVLNKRRREEAIRLQLRTRYPGDAGSAEIDYFLFANHRDENNAPCHRVVVFLANKITGGGYQNKKTPLIPGIVLMLAAVKIFNPVKEKNSNTANLNSTGKTEPASKSALVMIITPDWIEAAGFKNREITGHAAAKRTGVYPPFPLLATLCPEQDSSQTPALIILKDIPAADTYVSAICGQFMESRIIDIDDIISEINIKRSTIFRYRNTRQKVNRKWITAPLIIIQVLSLLLALHFLTVKAEDYHTVLEKTYREQTRYHEEEDKLLAEIGELENREASPAAEVPQLPDPYSLISEIRSRLPDVLIHSIIIQGERFNLEAEGADSIHSLNALRDSRYFFGITLHQTTPSKRGGERFSISGGIRHE
ncbi:hypothetical protein FACS1894130_08800 [Spirochaetia bacterium]|nr:hypothetical protein FACS1894130_08800 [Spirochaetia bacterium]